MNLKDMYKAWITITDKDQKKYVADLFIVKTKNKEEILCRDYSDIPAEDIASITKYTNCYPIDMNTVVEPSDEPALEITYTGGK